MKAVVAAFNQEKALVGAFSVITNFRMELFEALVIRDNMEYNWSVNGLHGTLKHVPHGVTLVIVVTSYHKTLLFVNN